MPPVTPERPDLRDGAARVPPPRRPSDPPLDEGGDQSAIAEARRREAQQRNAAAAELFAAGDFRGAAPMFEAALNSCRIVFGERHSETLRVAGNLGVTLVAGGETRRDVSKGIRLIETTIAARTAVLGAEHPDTLTAINALAVAHRRAGNPDKALEAAKRAVRARSEALGSTHVDTLTSRMGLALALAAAGENAAAHRIVDSTLKAAQETLGSRHPHVYALVACGEEAGLLRTDIT